jgi:hypothetical protein
MNYFRKFAEARTHQELYLSPKLNSEDLTLKIISYSSLKEFS